MLSDTQSEHSFSSALQLSKSGLCNLKLCVTLRSLQKVCLISVSQSLIWVLLLPVMPFKLTIFRYDCVISNFAKGFFESTG